MVVHQASAHVKLPAPEQGREITVPEAGGLHHYHERQAVRTEALFP
jgi:hypothetical protein